MQIKTLSDLKKKGSKEVIEEFLGRISIKEDLSKFLKYLHTNQVSTEFTVALHRWASRAPGIHPSSACKKNACLLKLYYECTVPEIAESDFDPNVQVTWDLGTMIHTMLQSFLNTMYGDQFQDEVSLIDNSMNVKSHTDGIFTFSDMRSVLEIKSIKEGGSFGWSNVQRVPFEDNVRQAHFYMKVADVPFANVLYLNKNGVSSGRVTEEILCIKEHPIAFDFDVWDDIETNTVQPVLSAVKNKTPPEAKPGFACKWCGFAYQCPEKKKERKGHAQGTNRRWRI